MELSPETEEGEVMELSPEGEDEEIMELAPVEEGDSEGVVELSPVEDDGIDSGEFGEPIDILESTEEEVKLETETESEEIAQTQARNLFKTRDYLLSLISLK